MTLAPFKELIEITGLIPAVNSSSVSLRENSAFSPDIKTSVSTIISCGKISLPERSIVSLSEFIVFCAIISLFCLSVILSDFEIPVHEEGISDITFILPSIKAVEKAVESIPREIVFVSAAE